MREYRETKQIEADMLDLDCYRLCDALDRFANKYNDQQIRSMASSIDGMRNRIRSHMHKDDRDLKNDR